MQEIATTQAQTGTTGKVNVNVNANANANANVAGAAASAGAASSVAGRQLFVGNLPFSILKQDLCDLFRDIGTVIRGEVAMSPAGKSRGFGSVLFSTVEEAQNAIATFNNYEWNGRKIEVREDRAVSGNGGSFRNPPANGVFETDGSTPVANVPLPGTNIDASTINVRSLYVGNLPYSVGWQDLKDLFRSCGNVMRADIPADYQSRSKGFGTVVMSTVEEARKGVSMYNGFEWNGRRLEVREDRTFVEGAPRPNFSAPQQNNSASIYQNFPALGNPMPSQQYNQHHHHGVIGSGINQPVVGSIPGGAVTGGAIGAVPSQSIAGRQLFIGNLPFSVQWQELKDLFRQVGTVQRADVAIDQQGRSRGHGQVLMSTVEEAAAAVRTFNGQEFQGRAIEVREDKYAANGGNGGMVAMAQGVIPDGSVPVGNGPMVGTQVFVGNLPFSTRWQELKDIFRVPHGLNPIHADVLLEAGSNRSKGCGIVRFTTREEAEKAVQTVNGTNINGRSIVVRLDKFA